MIVESTSKWQHTIIHEMNTPSVIAVSMYPGTMAFTLIFFSPSSAANARVKPREESV